MLTRLRRPPLSRGAPGLRKGALFRALRASAASLEFPCSASSTSRLRASCRMTLGFGSRSFRVWAPSASLSKRQSSNGADTKRCSGVPPDRWTPGLRSKSPITRRPGRPRVERRKDGDAHIEGTHDHVPNQASAEARGWATLHRAVADLQKWARNIRQYSRHRGRRRQSLRPRFFWSRPHPVWSRDSCKRTRLYDACTGRARRANTL